MVAGSASVKARQVVAGLLVLALLALSFGQAVAAPGLSSSDSHRTHHGIQELRIIERATVALVDANGHDHAGLPAGVTDRQG